MGANIVYIELGGNVGNRLKLISDAKTMLKLHDCNIIAQSAIYETPPWGFVATQTFYNQIVKIETALTPYELIKKLQKIENSLGRMRTSEGYESRTMDLDILFFNDEIIQKPELSIPHPRLHLRNFVLVPMTELAPNHRHPILLNTMAELLTRCSDNSKCTKVTNTIL